jgi:hypothetical protein
LAGADVTELSSFPTTTLPRTLIDLSACISESELDIALEHAVRRGHLSLRGLEERIGALTHHRLPGLRTLIDLIHARDPSGAATDSALETLVEPGSADSAFPNQFSNSKSYFQITGLLDWTSPIPTTVWVRQRRL